MLAEEPLWCRCGWNTGSGREGGREPGLRSTSAAGRGAEPPLNFTTPVACSAQKSHGRAAPRGQCERLGATPGPPPPLTAAVSPPVSRARHQHALLTPARIHAPEGRASLWFVHSAQDSAWHTVGTLSSWGMNESRLTSLLIAFLVHDPLSVSVDTFPWHAVLCR